MLVPKGRLVALPMVSCGKLGVDVLPVCLVLPELFEPWFSLRVVIFAHPMLNCGDIGQ